MTESHEAIAPLDRGAQPRASARSGVPDLVEHLQRAAGRATVQRTGQRADRADHGGPESGAGRRDDARS